ncbi:hypothetical protein RCG24_02025 [Neobacillus sp. OS1-32]|uniref:YqgU-like beta propeller domain-containing protein n=1 Tax=Neobacillus sp. OS1-32 TaxID=3070682 RepID=UPI0027E08BCB|nr:hypothetical protein [Neobacillus sp. OS1-32]WML30715.1 hypothetical protein RCG24_02025 [Neobacillus sp. OS1-32]
MLRLHKNLSDLAILFVLIPLLLSACMQQEPEKPKVNVSVATEKAKDIPASHVREWKLPIAIPEGEFDKIAGWLTDTQILYITNLQQSSNVYRYDLLSGKSELIFHSDHPIVSLQISPAKKYLLIHSSPSTYEGVVTIIDMNGTELLKKVLVSHELAYEWNPYDESKVLITEFAEDWTFKVLLMDLKNNETTKLSLSQPFIKWLSQTQLAYVNWDKEQPVLVAPLIRKDLKTGKETSLFKDLIQFSAFPHLLLTITVNDQQRSNAIYSFYDREFKQLFSFSIPQLTRFSDWLVPYFDYNESSGSFITLQPKNSGEADTYTGGFDLVKYNLNKEEKQLIMGGLENEPVIFAPSGEALLYGNRFEKIIDLHERKLYQALKE